MTDAWTFREGVSEEHVFDFLLCIVDIIDAVNELKDADKDDAGLKAISAARHISIPLRKLLLDGNGRLLKSCFAVPNFHPLKRPSPNERPITIVQKFKRPTMILGFEDGRETTIEVPEYEQRTTIHPLYGMRHDSAQAFVIEMPFDRDAHPIKFKAWMNTKVLQVDDMMFTAKDLLREVVNHEGAHIKDGKKFGMPDASSLAMDNMESQRYRAVNAVRFGALSYAQNFTICTGLYIASRSKTLIADLPLDKDGKAVADICKKIDGCPTKLRGRGEMENQTYHMLVLGSDLKLRSESIGDYSTLMKIPGPPPPVFDSGGESFSPAGNTNESQDPGAGKKTHAGEMAGA